MLEQIAKKYSWFIPLLVCLGFILILGNDFVNLDDDFLIYDNATVTDGRWDGALGKIFEFQFGTSDYKPIVFLVYKTLYSFFGDNPLVFHLFSLLLHGLNSLLVFFILKELFSASKSKYSFSALGALLWGLNPLKVESVAWASEFEDVMYGFFFLGAIYAFLQFLKGGQKKWIWGLIVIVSFILSFLSKALAIILPILLLWVFLFKTKNKGKYRHWMILGLPLLAFIGFVGIYFIKADWFATQVNNLSGYGIFNPPTILGKVGAIAAAIWVMLFKGVVYMVRFVFPFQLSVIYPFEEAIIQHQILLYASPIIVLGLVYLIYRNASKFPSFYLGLGMLFIMMSPIFLIGVTGTNFISDRYYYMASLGFVVMLLGFLEYLSGRVLLKYIQGGMIGFIILFFALTMMRTQVWKNSETLFSDLMDKYPTEPISYNGIGHYLFEKGDKDGGVAYFSKALELNPNLKEALMNRAVYKFEKKDYPSALEDLNRFVTLYPTDYRAYGARGGVLAKMGRIEEAIADLKKAQELDLYSLDAYLNLGKVYIAKEEYQLAADNYKSYLHFYPKDAEMNYLTGVLEEKLGRYQESIRFISIGIEENPSNGRYYVSRAKAYYLLDQKDKAKADVAQAKTLGIEVSQKFIDLLNTE